VCLPAGFGAVIDCWGGNVIVDDKSQLNAKRPVAPIDLTQGLRCPLLGLFGNDDENLNADQVNRTEAELKRLGKAYEFYRYNGAEEQSARAAQLDVGKGIASCLQECRRSARVYIRRSLPCAPASRRRPPTRTRNAAPRDRASAKPYA
jgi:Dienelactone hydrolase family